MNNAKLDGMIEKGSRSSCPDSNSLTAAVGDIVFTADDLVSCSRQEWGNAHIHLLARNHETSGNVRGCLSCLTELVL